MPRSPEPSPETGRRTAAEPRRRKRAAAPMPVEALRRKSVQILLGFVTAVLLIDALVGERGLSERLRAGRQYAEVAASLAAMRDENARLRETARRLTDDASTIESLARKELGLLRPGELLFIIKDARPTQ